MLRRWLLVLLMLALPLQAWAALQPMPVPCAAMAGMDGEGGGAMSGGELADCCNDLATLLRTGHLCQSDADCGAPLPTAFAPPAAAAAALPATRERLMPAAAPPPPAGAPSAVWRPPSAR